MMIVPILMQGKFTEITGLFSNADKTIKKQLLTTLSSIDIANLNKYKEILE
jgi:cephalosporin-C deacetylase-like acetyl esterase